MRKQIAMAVVVLLSLSVLSTDLRADEEKIAFEKLPAAVKKTIKRKFPKAEIEGASKEVEDGTTTYEVELEIKDRSVDVALKADGTILEIEREVPVNELPKAVKKALAARYPKAKIEKVEEIVKGEHGPVHYEVAIKAEVVFTAKGKIVKGHEDEDEKSSTKARKSKKDDEDEDEDDEDQDEEHEVKAKKGDKDKGKIVKEKEDEDEKSSIKARKSKKDDKDDEDEDEEHEVKAKKGDKD